METPIQSSYGKVELPCYPTAAGVYIITDSSDNVYYIGHSKLLCRRASHLTALQPDKSNDAGYSHIYALHVRTEQDKGNKLFIRFIITEDYRSLEKELIAKYNPIWNKN